MTAKKKIRCAIYTRKSSEEGLEQDFNSLHAQREACQAYITSQTHEGWRIVKRLFDDGGWSGGTLERPALNELLAEIRAGRVDVIVIYKIDRLTRSLTDFAKLAELFDAHGVSFVSVTQQFNTTTSMGRLMLNVLLSFAQFEREITGERIRDKIAASKKKGMWMGGLVPLGYDAVDRQLIINIQEARTVRTLFALYLKLRNVSAVWAEALKRGLTTKRRQKISGETSGERPFSRGHLYRLLRNPIYAGRIAHRDETFDGLHEAIIDPDTWDQVQNQLTMNARKTKIRQTAAVPGLLVRLLFDADGHRLTHAHATKGQRRYRYYIDRASKADDETARTIRIPANQIEPPVQEALIKLLKTPADLMDAVGANTHSSPELPRALRKAKSLAATLEQASPADWVQHLQALLRRVIVEPNGLCLIVNRDGMATALGNSEKSDEGIRDYEYRVPAKLIHRSGQMKIIIKPADELEGGIDEALIQSIGRAHAWFEQLQRGDVGSVREIAARENFTTSYVMRYFRLAFLAPDIVETILKGRQPPGISVRKLTNFKQLPASWIEQRRLLNIPSP
jgi:DNA invertase Pin-like site-specific DNA recombinase